jgi:hypothetical protein
MISYTIANVFRSFKWYLGSLQLDENVRERNVRLKRKASINFWPGVHSFRRFVAQYPEITQDVSTKWHISLVSLFSDKFANTTGISQNRKIKTLWGFQNPR